MSLIAGIEAGGTKFICGIGDEDGKIIEKISIPTTTPEETMSKVIEYFKTKKFEAMGVGSFGPLNLSKKSENYGMITETPKKLWKNFNIFKSLKSSFDIPIEINTDVNAAAFGEYYFGSAKSKDNLLYITVGTGIGCGSIINGESIQGLTHSEMGHIYVRRNKNDNFKGICDFHHDCLEGLASGPAIEKRWGKPAVELYENPEVWELESDYLAQAIVNYILIISPEVIIMGGGVMHQLSLFPLIHKKVQKLLNEYISEKRINENIEEYIIPSKLMDDQGLMGAIALGKKGLER